MTVILSGISCKSNVAVTSTLSPATLSLLAVTLTKIMENEVSGGGPPLGWDTQTTNSDLPPGAISIPPSEILQEERERLGKLGEETRFDFEKDGKVIAFSALARSVVGQQVVEDASLQEVLDKQFLLQLKETMAPPKLPLTRLIILQLLFTSEIPMLVPHSVSET